MSDWKQILGKEVPAYLLLWNQPMREKFSRDYFDFSPVLLKSLTGRIAECVAMPRTFVELARVLAVARDYGVPVTVRGAGTGNYGQAVPLQGGIVLDMSHLNRVMAFEDDQVTVEAGARMGFIESVARQRGLELRVYPSTFQKATIGGFVRGGSGGIGSITWGTLWDSLVPAMRIRAMDEALTVYEVQGEDVTPYLHDYGTLGVAEQLTIKLAARTEWVQIVAGFPGLNTAWQCAQELAINPTIKKRLVSLHEWPIPEWFRPWNQRISPGHSLLLMEVEYRASDTVKTLVDSHCGHIDLIIDPDKYHKSNGVSDFSWNHTTLWARKTSSRWTYLQTRFDPHRLQEQIQAVKLAYPEILLHFEWIRERGHLVVSGLPLIPFTNEKHLNELTDFLETNGIPVANPHTFRLEAGGRMFSGEQFWQLKERNDPQNLLNPGKLKNLSERSVLTANNGQGGV